MDPYNVQLLELLEVQERLKGRVNKLTQEYYEILKLMAPKAQVLSETQKALKIQKAQGAPKDRDFQVPGTPKVPKSRDAPGPPKVPKSRDAPGTPETSKVPKSRNAQEAPGVSKVPKVPKAPKLQEVQEIQEDPELQEDQEAREEWNLQKSKKAKKAKKAMEAMEAMKAMEAMEAKKLSYLDQAKLGVLKEQFETVLPFNSEIKPDTNKVSQNQKTAPNTRYKKLSKLEMFQFHELNNPNFKRLPCFHGSLCFYKNCGCTFSHPEDKNK